MYVCVSEVVLGLSLSLSFSLSVPLALLSHSQSVWLSHSLSVSFCTEDPKAISSVREYAEYLLRGTLPYLGDSKKQSTFQMMAMLYGIKRK
jgi:hypothetical protein